ncbi:MAG TPA: aromatic ring-hydroxylating dioxygenase subunit alpha [Candidatus Limnocylindrales bacterium]|nr:aromatic ring-hydroxylating dioxygenase subunit alpha [Candidatus Limnocylindrales bacterium]
MTTLARPADNASAALARHGPDHWHPRPTLAREDYASAAVFEAERDRIWFGGWVCTGRSEDVATSGDYLVRDIAGESIVVVRNADGEPRAFYNVCAHRGTKLLDDGAGHASRAIKCPYHAWSFDLDGRLIGTPNVHEDEAFDRAEHPLHGIRVGEFDGFLFVSLADDVEPLAESLLVGAETIVGFERYRMAELRPARRIDYDVAANWKVIVENYNECLHCPTVHPELVALVPLYRKGEVWSDETPDGGNLMRDGATSFTVTGGSNLPPFPGLSEMDRRTYYGTFQFPNLMVNLHPDAMMTYRLEPMGPARTRVISEFYFRPETIADPAFDPSPVVDLWDTISRQDWVIVERAQRGVSSRGFRGGVYPRNDRLAFDFDERWRLAMGRPLVG